MAPRITDEDLRIRHTALCRWLAVLGYIDEDMSKATILKVDAKVKAAVAKGDVVCPAEGHYELTPRANARLRNNNAAQPRSRQTPSPRSG